MYAIIESGGKQYKIEEGKKIRLEKFPNSEGEEVQIREVLAINDGNNIVIGNPYIDGAYVHGKIVLQNKQKKVTIFKYKKRKDSKKKMGHRQPYTELLIEKIFLEAPHGA
jgi:large subunit ribosomal protein L21